MTIHISDLMRLKDLNDRMIEGYVGVQEHPDLPLVIYNYTPKAMIDNVWDEVTEHCRGLIVENGTGLVVARGMKKFYNVGQKEALEPNMFDEVIVTRKEDGSLGIVWEYDGQFGVATRGSFMSPQAIHATELLNTDEYQWLRQSTDSIVTPLVEIVYPEGRIVLDYGDRDELIPLGEVGPEGVFWWRHQPGNPLTSYETYMTYGEALKLEIPDDEEGYVLDILGMEGTVRGHVKLKGERYKYLHYIMTNLNARRIWEEYSARILVSIGAEFDKSMDYYLNRDHRDMLRVDTTKDFWETFESVPDEFIDWVKEVWNRVEDEYNLLMEEALELADKLKTLEGRERYEAGKTYEFFKELNFVISRGDVRPLSMRLLRKLMPSGSETPFKEKFDG